MSLSSFRRVAPSSYRSLRGTRFAASVSNSCAFDARPASHHKASEPISPQGSTARGGDHLGHPSRTLESSKTESYLLSLLTDDVTPSLRDLERLKPPEHPGSHSKEYTAVYSALLGSICRSFSHDQLRSFTQQYGLSLGSKLRKASYAEAIVEKAWQWPSLRELKRARSGRPEVTSLGRYVYTSLMRFRLILSRDGSDLFQLSREYNVYASVKRNPLSLYLEGSRDSVKGTEEYIDRVRKGIVEDTFDTPSKHPVPQEAFHSISRLSGAFLETTEDQKVRICLSPAYIVLTLQVTCPSQASLEYHVSEEAGNKKPSELLSQQIHYKDNELRTPTAAPLAYSLYPFSGPRLLPTMTRSSTFLRWRRVGDWLGDTRSQSLDTSGLAQSRGSLFSIDGAETDLQHRLLGNITSNGTKRLVSAFSGHILFPVSRVDEQGSLKSPHTGGLTYTDTRSWVAAQRTSATFYPSLPLELVKALPSQQRVLHRLIYRCSPVFEQDSRHSSTTKFIRIEVPLIDHKHVQHPVGLPDRSIFTNAMFWGGTSANVDLLMPDRYMDLRFNVSDISPLPSTQQPGELMNYLDGLQKFLTCSDPDVMQPVPPLVVSHDDHEYVLATNASVRQSAESLSSVPSKDITVTSESMLDLESGYSTAVCMVSSDNLDSPQTWDAFLDKCDRLTAKSSLKNSTFL
ncbi:hypothetical protein EDB86DRAFT_2802958 [Lactarius hatsudake]|nr:hypothetical protein EDB86DRAFT_2802958 [Lactarius hatsudake]